MNVIRGKKALVTGAASGIGRAIAVALAREGAALYLLDIDQVGLANTVREAESHGVEVTSTICDLREPGEVSAAVAALSARWGELHILVNNAGVLFYGPAHRMSDEQWDQVMAVNLAAPIRLTRRLFPMLVKSGDAHVVNMCSVFGLVGSRNIAAYQTSKHGLVAFTNALRTEYSGRGFGASAICPGFVSTSMIERVTSPDAPQQERAGKAPSTPPKWTFTTPETVAAKTIAAIRKNRGLVVITPAARLLWWLYRVSPAMVDWVAREGWRKRGAIEI
jgi:3-oxoacyl-[acyl-carrier protein] reductase